MNAATVVEALIPLCGGAYATLLGYSIIKRPTTDPKKLALLDHMKWLGPIVVAFGALQLLQGLFQQPRSIAHDIVVGMREKITLPAVVDEVTTLDGFEAEGQRIIYRMTITAALPTEPEREALLARMREHLKSQICADESRRRLLRQNITLSFVYTLGGRPYPGIVINEADCGSS